MLERAVLMDRALGWTGQGEEQRWGQQQLMLPSKSCSACFFPKFFLTAQ